MTDYYDILKIPKTASDEEVKLAYRRLARQHHPDLHPESEKSSHTEQMQKINEAYAVLGAKENRKKYDAYGERWQEGPPPQRPPTPEAPRSSGAPEGFSDFFRDMFRQSSSQDVPDERFASELDIEATLDLSLEDAVQGIEKSFSLMTEGLCPQCRGTGHVKNALCPMCGGMGEIRKARDVKARIPAGLSEGSRIRLKGQGNASAHGLGDLYLRIRLSPHTRFRVQGNALEMDARLTPWQAALGTEISLQTLDGQVRVRIAKGTHTGTRLRLAGKGLGKPGERGDLFVRLDIDISQAMSPKAEALYRQLQEENNGAAI
jgi:curved DNA-binding protein